MNVMTKGSTVASKAELARSKKGPEFCAFEGIVERPNNVFSTVFEITQRLSGCEVLLVSAVIALAYIGRELIVNAGTLTVSAVLGATAQSMLICGLSLATILDRRRQYVASQENSGNHSIEPRVKSRSPRTARKATGSDAS